jgi:ABC-type branched-subunit amino acid transport system substrate-binding protein
VLLPLSGSYASFGEPCLRGIRLAFGAVGQAIPDLRLVVIDSRGDVAGAVEGYRRLARDPGIVAVLGPMLAAEVDAIVPHAESLGLATITFSQRAPEGPGPVLRFSMTREDQARALASWLVGEKSLHRWAILRPDDPFGRDMAGAFREEVVARGGRVVTELAYDPTKTDFQTDAQRLQGRLGFVANEPAPIDGIFLPDSAERVVLLAPHLAFADIRGVQLAGVASWDKPDLLGKAGPSVSGAVFPDGFFRYSFSPGVRSFVDAYRDAYRADPGILDAYGYDAAALVRFAIREGSATRARLVERLKSPRWLDGPTGATRIAEDGRVEKSLFLLTIEDGVIREIERPTPVRLLSPVEPGGPARGEVWHAPEFDSRTPLPSPEEEEEGFHSIWTRPTPGPRYDRRTPLPPIDDLLE